MPRPRYPKVRAVKRAVEWFDTLVNFTVAAGAQNVLTLNDPLDDEKKGSTLLRMIVDLGLVAATAGNTGTLIAMGSMIAPDDAIAAGAVSDPDNFNEQPNWIFRTQESVYTSVANDRTQQVMIKQDRKTARLFRGSTYEHILVTNNVSGGLTPVNVDGLVRCLWAKPR